VDWSRRVAIAVGAAQGLAYLHHDSVPAIVHRDVKSNNILLDREFVPRVADFGLAKTLQREATQGAMSRVAGSYGYIAPGQFSFVFLHIYQQNFIVMLGREFAERTHA